MNILYKSLHNINLEADELTRKEINEDFELYLKDYISFSVRENETKRNFKIEDENATVAHCISEIFMGVISQSETISELADSIARKLLNVEKDVQSGIVQMGIHVQRGSVIQALVEDEEGYKYIIAKVEHLEFIEAQNFRRDIGFPSENKRVWKSAVIPINYSDDVVNFGISKCYAKTGEKYWTHLFLEMDPVQDDEKNTHMVYIEVNRVLSKKVKTHSPADYTQLQNALIVTLQSEQQINYPDMIERLVGTYSPTDDNLNIHAIKEELLALKDLGKFDTQFNSVPKAVKNAKKRKYPLTESMDLYVKEGINDIKKSIMAIKEPNGEKYLKILCENERTYKSFVEE